MTRISVLLVAAIAMLALAIPSAQASTQKTKGNLVGSVGPSFTISFTQNGKKVTSLKAGTYKITVHDNATIHNFHLFGHGINKKTGVQFVGTQVWTVKFVAKGTYKFHCDVHPTILFGSFKIT